MGVCHCFFFIDACGAEVVRPHAAFTDLAPRWKPLRSVFGYSSACVPSILSGAYPEEHLHWSFFCRIAGQMLRLPGWMRLIPPPLANRGRVRGRLSRGIARANGISGYFQVYQMPFKHLHEYSHCEPRDIFAPGGLNQGTTFVDDLQDKDPATWWVADWHEDTATNWETMRTRAADPRSGFLFMYDAALDAWLHDHTREDPTVGGELAAIRQRIDSVLAAARSSHDEVRFHVFSDHGMCSITSHLDALGCLARSRWTMHEDYHCVVDSTMVRLWYGDGRARSDIQGILSGIPGLRRLDEHQLATWRCAFPDDRFGEEIWLADPGILILPSHMGSSPLRGMHGYSPEHQDSDASYLTNTDEDPVDIVGINPLMRRAIRELAARA